MTPQQDRTAAKTAEQLREEKIEKERERLAAARRRSSRLLSAFFVLGLVLVAAGAGLAYLPAGLFVPGAVLLGVSIAGAWRIAFGGSVHDS